MAVIHLFDNLKNYKKPIKDVLEIIHSEGDYTATAEILSKDRPECGDYFGLKCVDGRFRMFLIRMIETEDETGRCTLTATDAAVADLNGMICERLTLTQKTAQEAAQELLSGWGWEIARAEAEGSVEAPDAYFDTVWDVLKTIANAAKVRIIPYYEFAEGGGIRGKIDILSKEPVWRGLIHTRKKGANNIRIKKEGIPYGRVYGLGKVTGSGDPPERVTFRDVVWSTANGDPADKPAGQNWVALPGAKTYMAYVFENNRQEDSGQLLRESFEDLQSKRKPIASGSANIGEMEFLPGYGHRIVRLWDKAVVRTEEGDTADTTVIGIKRYYVKRYMTKIILGDEKETDIYRIERQMAELNKATASNARGVGGARAGNKENAEQILLRATKTEVLEMGEQTNVRFNEVSLELDAIHAKIELKASKTIVDNLENVVDQHSAALTVQAEEISTKVSHNGVISAINQTAEQITISASKINLSGYVTSSTLNAELVSIQNAFANSFGTFDLSATNISCSNLKVEGTSAEWWSKEFVTSVTLKGTSSFAVKDTAGITHTIYAGYSISTGKDRMSYLGAS